MAVWRPESHFIVHVLSFLKKVFYVKSFEGYTSIANKEALRLMTTDKDTYLEKIEESIKFSQVMYDLITLLSSVFLSSCVAVVPFTAVVN